MPEDDLREMSMDLTQCSFKLYPGNHSYFQSVHCDFFSAWKTFQVCAVQTLFSFLTSPRIIHSQLDFVVRDSLQTPDKLWNIDTGKGNTNSVSHTHRVSPADLFFCIEESAADVL